jgi:hypothetical protein
MRRAMRRLPLLALLACLTVAGLAGTALAGTHTRARIYEPFKASGKPAFHVSKTYSGSCFAASIAVNRRDAWRCMSGNAINDPCFSSAKAKGVVLCPASGPWKKSLIKIKYKGKLPGPANKGKPSTRGLPWALITTSGWKCRLDTGATQVVGGKRENYFCSGTSKALWGGPKRSVEPWTIYVAPNSATSLSQTTGIRSAWF